MMNASQKDLRTEAQNLALLLRKSPEYQNYIAAKEKLKNHGQIVALLSDFRQRQLHMQLARMLGEDVTDEEEQIDDLYVNLSMNPAVNEFLNAEYSLIRLLDTVRDIFGKELDFGVDMIIPDRIIN